MDARVVLHCVTVESLVLEEGLGKIGGSKEEIKGGGVIYLIT